MIPRLPTTILAYHAIGIVDPVDDPSNLFVTVDAFVEQMDFLAAHRRVVSVTEALDGLLDGGKPAVAITFDDGYQCLLDRALPVLEAHGFPATVFVPTGLLGSLNPWESEADPVGVQIMSADEVRAANERGLAAQSHGHAHINFAQVTRSSALEDLERSVEVLTALVGRTPEYLAYPWGRNGSIARDIAAEVGFRAAFTIGTRDRGPFARARVPINRQDPMWRFRLKTSGYWPILRFSRAGEPVRWAARTMRTHGRGMSTSDPVNSAGEPD